MIKILGTGSYVPEKVLTNFDLEKTLDTSNEWIIKRTGIKERRIAAPEESTVSFSVNAAKKAITEYLDKKQFESLHKDVTELITILTSICKTSQEKIQNNNE